MNLKKASIFAAGGIVYTIVLKLAVSINPELLTIESVLKITKILTIMAISALLVFAYFFYKDYLKPGQIKLKYAVIAVGFFIFLNLLLHLKQLPHIFPALNTFLYNHLYILYLASTSRILENLSPLSGFLFAVVLFYFFWIFYNEIKRTNKSLLTKSVFYMLIVSALGLVVRFITVVLYISYDDYGQILNSSFLIYLVIYPIFVISSAAQVYFFWTFYNSVDFDKA